MGPFYYIELDSVLLVLLDFGDFLHDEHSWESLLDIEHLDEFRLPLIYQFGVYSWIFIWRVLLGVLGYILVELFDEVLLELLLVLGVDVFEINCHLIC